MNHSHLSNYYFYTKSIYILYHHDQVVTLLQVLKETSVNKMPYYIYCIYKKCLTLRHWFCNVNVSFKCIQGPAGHHAVHCKGCFPPSIIYLPFIV